MDTDRVYIPALPDVDQTVVMNRSKTSLWNFLQGFCLIRALGTEPVSNSGGGSDSSELEGRFFLSSSLEATDIIYCAFHFQSSFKDKAVNSLCYSTAFPRENQIFVFLKQTFQTAKIKVEHV